MKKLKKSMAILLAGIMLFSIFSVSVSAEEMTVSDIVKAYHSLLKETAEKHKLIQVKEDYEYEFAADLSGLSGLDLKLTEELFTAVDNLEVLDDGVYYYNGVSGEYEDPAESEFYETFNVADYLEWGYEVESAVYSNNTIVIEIVGADEYYESMTITVELADGNVIKKITEETYSEMPAESLIKKIPFTVVFETKNAYTLTYEEVPATSLTLSETSFTLGYEGVAEITYTVGPDDASFKDVYVSDVYNENYEIVAWAYEENGKIIIEAVNEGTGIMEVYTVSGDILATCEITVEYTFWDRIRSIFDSILSWFGFGWWF